MNRATISADQHAIIPLPTMSGAMADWRVSAIDAHRHTAAGAVARLKTDLANRLLALTGRLVAAEAIYVDPAAPMAQAVVDGAIFRLQGRDLVLLRPCAHCGQELFASPPLVNRAALGYALADWEPRCAHCQPEDPRED
jgi:hypothetical protein